MRVLLAFILLILSVAPSHAKTIVPGFDCAKAQSVQERLICADQKLAEADKQLSRAFSATEQILETPRLDDFRAEQKSWLGDLPNKCPETAPNLKSCLLDTYRKRTSELIELNWGPGPKPILKSTEIREYTQKLQNSLSKVSQTAKILSCDSMVFWYATKWEQSFAGRCLISTGRGEPISTLICDDEVAGDFTLTSAHPWIASPDIATDLAMSFIRANCEPGG